MAKRKPKIKIRWSPLSDAERAKIEDIGQPWSPPANMHRMPDGSLYAPADDLNAWPHPKENNRENDISA